MNVKSSKELKLKSVSAHVGFILTGIGGKTSVDIDDMKKKHRRETTLIEEGNGILVLVDGCDPIKIMNANIQSVMYYAPAAEKVKA